MEKKLLSKIASAQDCPHRLSRQLTKLSVDCLSKEDRYDFVLTQLVNIAEHGHPLREQIFTYIFDSLVPTAPANVLDSFVQKVTHGQATQQDSMPYYLADYALANKLDAVLAQLINANSELQVYIVSSGALNDEVVIQLLASGTLTVEMLLAKISLFLPRLQGNNVLANALFQRLKDFQFAAASLQAVGLDQVTNLVVLLGHLEGTVGKIEADLCCLNLMVQLRQATSQVKASIHKYIASTLAQKKQSSQDSHIQALISVIEQKLITEAVDQSEAENLSTQILPYRFLRHFIPSVKVLPLKQGVNTERISRIITELLPAPRSTPEIFTYRQAFKSLQEKAHPEEYSTALQNFFSKKQNQPHLNKILDYDSLDTVRSGSQIDLYRLIRTLITHANLTNKASIDLTLYQVFTQSGLTRLSLLTDLSLRMLDNKYFDLVKDSMEDFFANGRPSVRQATHVVGLIRRIARCDKTEYSGKLLEMVQSILAVLNAKGKVDAMSRDEQRLLEMSIGVLTDMVEHQVLQFFLTLSIMKRKFAALAKDLATRVKQGKYSFGYGDFLATVKSELEELNLDECFYQFTTRPSRMSMEEKDAYDTCLKANEIVFDHLLASPRETEALSCVAYYFLDQGLRAKIARDYHSKNESEADEAKTVAAIDMAFKESQTELWDKVMGVCNASILQAVAGDDGDTRGVQCLLTELIRIDLKNKAESRQLRNIDIAKQVQQAKALSIDDQIAQVKKSVASAAKFKLYGVVPKTLLNLLQAVKAGRQGSSKLISVLVGALSGLEEETLLKVGSDLSLLSQVALDNSSEQSTLLALISRIGALDNELTVCALRNKAEVLAQLPLLLKQLIKDLVKHYLKPQVQACTDELSQLVQMQGQESCVNEAVLEMHLDKSIDQNSLDKFMNLCVSLKLHTRVASDEGNALAQGVEKARLMSWLNVPRGEVNSQAQAILRVLAEADLASKAPQAGPFGSEGAFIRPSLNALVQAAKRCLLQGGDMALEATALTFMYVLASKTDTTAATYVSGLVSETDLPQLDLVCSFLREPIATHGLDLAHLSKQLDAFKELSI